jgi:hypothetical protein
MNALTSLLTDAPGTLSVTRLSLFVVLTLITLAVGRWLLTGTDIPHGIGSLLEITLATTASAKVAQKFAETKQP